MDIAGAKALRERLGEKSEEDTTPPAAVTSAKTLRRVSLDGGQPSRTRRLTVTTHPLIAWCRSFSGSASASVRSAGSKLAKLGIELSRPARGPCPHCGGRPCRPTVRQPSGSLRRVFGTGATGGL